MSFFAMISNMDFSAGNAGDGCGDQMGSLRLSFPGRNARLMSSARLMRPLIL